MQRLDRESIVRLPRSDTLVTVVVFLLILASATSVGLVVAAEGEGVLLPEGTLGPFRAAHWDAIDLTDSVTSEAWIKPRAMGP
jgi:hypothetical protein